MNEQYFNKPNVHEAEKFIDSEKLIKVVDNVSIQLSGLYGFEIEWVISTLRREVFPLVKLNSPNENPPK